MSQIRHFKKKRFIFLTFLIPIVVVVLLVPCLVYAQNPVASLLGYIIMPIVGLFGKLMTVLIKLLISVAQYNDFINSAAVSKGWIIIRDVFNIGFVLILLVIAFATVLKIEKYSYKRLLGGFLLAAVLVNFSKLICGVIIDISQVLTLTFVNAFKAMGEGNLAQMIGLKDIMSLPNENNGGTAGTEKIGALILGLIMSIIGTIVVGIILLIFVFRIIILWFLVLLSPLAFLSNVLPSLQSYGKQWWQKFTHQVIIGPILAFLLWLSFSIVQGSSGGDIYKQVLTDPGVVRDVTDTEITAAISEAGRPQDMLNFIIGIGLLMGSLMVAQQLGVAGGKMAGSAVGKIQAVAKGMGKLGLKGVDRTVEKVGKGAVRGIGKITKAKSLQRFQGISYDIAKDALRQKKQEKSRQRKNILEGAAEPIAKGIDKNLDPGVWDKRVGDIFKGSKKKIREATEKKTKHDKDLEGVNERIDKRTSILESLNKGKRKDLDLADYIKAGPLPKITPTMKQDEKDKIIALQKGMAAAIKAAKKDKFTIKGSNDLETYLRDRAKKRNPGIANAKRYMGSLNKEKENITEKTKKQADIISTERYRPGLFKIKQRDRLDLTELGARNRQAETSKDVALSTNGEEALLIEEIKKSLARKDGDRAIASIELLTKINGHNALMLDKTIQNQVRKLIGEKYTKTDAKGNNLAVQSFDKEPVSLPALRLFYENVTKKAANLNDYESARTMARIGSIGGLAGNFSLTGLAHIDSVTGLPQVGGINQNKDTGALEMDSQWARITRFKANQVEPQTFWKNAHSSTFATENNEGKGAHLHKGGEEYLAHLSGKDLAQMSRMRDDTLWRLNEKSVLSDIREFANQVSKGLVRNVNQDQGKLISAFADTLLKLKTEVDIKKK